MEEPSTWASFGAVTVFRWLPHGATYDPASPWYSPESRFGSANRVTLYVAENSTGAMAEFYRRNPEFLQMQDAVRVRLFQIELLVAGLCLDLRTEERAQAAGVVFEDLRSSSPTYEVCQSLGDAVCNGGVGVGVGYPSASYRDHAWNLVLFGDPSPTSWESVGANEVPRPYVLPADVTLID